jgi:hypothetical protein
MQISLTQYTLCKLTKPVCLVPYLFAHDTRLSSQIHFNYMYNSNPKFIKVIVNHESLSIRDLSVLQTSDNSDHFTKYVLNCSQLLHFKPLPSFVVTFIRI